MAKEFEKSERKIMKQSIAVLDISGRIPVYDDYFCDSLSKITDVILYSPNCDKGSNFMNYPTYKLMGDGKKYGWLNIYAKAFWGLLNYFWFGVLLIFKRYRIVHMQWLPFLEKTNVEVAILKIYRVVSPRTKFVYTHHNLYPHNYAEKRKESYRIRVHNVAKYLDHIVVHTRSTKKAVSAEFDIPEAQISVIPHGTFVPPSFPQRKRRDESKLRLLMFGNQTFYKGTDLLVDAYSMLPNEDRQKIEVRIIGNTDDEMKTNIKPVAESLGIQWEAKYIEDNELYQEIADADVLVFPYRAISQSGALLLALPFMKPVILSDLPSFKETMSEFPQYAFFETGSSESLKEVMEYYIHNNDCFEEEIRNLKILNDRYSWKSSARELNSLYSRIREQ